MPRRRTLPLLNDALAIDAGHVAEPFGEKDSRERAAAPADAHPTPAIPQVTLWEHRILGAKRRLVTLLAPFTARAQRSAKRPLDPVRVPARNVHCADTVSVTRR